MIATLVILLLWLGFATTHMGLASVRVRPLLVDRLGERVYLGFYSLVSLALFVPLFWFYLMHKHAGPQLWSIALTPPARYGFYLLVGAAMTLAVLGVFQPSPASIVGGPMSVRGVARITRHPLFMGFGLVGLLHLVPNGAASDVAFFGGLPVFAVVGCGHQDRRKLATGVVGYRDYVAMTPFLPFTRPGALRGIREVGLVRLGLAIAVTVLIRWYHPVLFG
jgi:uncharacterized membrane protein